MKNRIFGCEINDHRYVVIYEMMRWNFYRIVGDSTMRTTPTKGLSFKDCILWESDEIDLMGKKFLQLKTFLQVI